MHDSRFVDFFSLYRNSGEFPWLSKTSPAPTGTNKISTVPGMKEITAVTS